MELDPVVLPPQQPALTGWGLHLRPWRHDDAPDLVRACQDPQTWRYTSVPEPYTEQEAWRMIHRQAPEGYESGRAAAFAVLDETDGSLCGSVGLVRLSLPRRTAEVGYWVAPWARGRGVATRSTRVVLDWAFALGFDRVELLAEPENGESLAVARACGFVVEGTLREYSFIAGRRRDLVMHSLLRHEHRPGGR